MARVRVEYTFLVDENENLREMMYYHEAAIRQDNIIMDAMQDQINIKNSQLENRHVAVAQWEEKYYASLEHVKKERRKKFLYMGTTAGALALLVFSLVQ